MNDFDKSFSETVVSFDSLPAASQIDYYRAKAKADAIEAEALRAEVTRLRGALGEIALQKKFDEIENEIARSNADFEGGYDTCIDVARAALGVKGDK